MNGSETPLAYLHTAGPAADPITSLAWGLGAVSIAVIVVIGLLLAGAIFRRRTPPPNDPAGDSGSALMPLRPHEGLRWIYVGTGASAVILFACATWTLWTLSAIAAPTAKPRVTVEVRGFQYWWRVRYLDASGNVLLTTANEIHVPVGEPVRFQLSSGDVIHSFWVPSLAGKMDAIPGQTNVSWLQADRPGRYRGQCSEYCGAQHAHMALFVDAESPARFAAWMSDQARDAVRVPSSDADGQSLFVDRCGGCHAVRGTSAKGALAPDLTHLMARGTIAAGALPNDRASLARWLAFTQQLKPGSEMPTVTLGDDERRAIVEYLATLR